MRLPGRVDTMALDSRFTGTCFIERESRLRSGAAESRSGRNRHVPAVGRHLDKLKRRAPWPRFGWARVPSCRPKTGVAGMGLGVGACAASAASAASGVCRCQRRRADQRRRLGQSAEHRGRRARVRRRGRETAVPSHAVAPSWASASISRCWRTRIARDLSVARAVRAARAFLLRRSLAPISATPKNPRWRSPRRSRRLRTAGNFHVSRRLGETKNHRGTPPMSSFGCRDQSPHKLGFSV